MKPKDKTNIKDSNSVIKYDIIEKIDINQEIQKSFLSYAMSVIISRALPEIRDGLKPVQRRILYGMKVLGVNYQSSHKKSSRIVGDVMGKYHPHGDSSIYEAMVRMAQNFNYRYPLIDGHGNFGSIDGDAAAAMRYTEVKMSKLSMELMKEIDQNTIKFIPNYDGNEKEPVVLPSSFPNLLMNGSTGIAVGMATNIPPHNLREVIDAVIAYIENKEIDISGLIQFIKGPDFPTGGELLGVENLKEAYETGRGRVFIRAKTSIIQKDKNKPSVLITEIPYQIKKSALIERIVFLAKEKIIDGIVDLRDESSNREGIKIVIDLRKDINPKIFLNNLYKHSQLHISFNFNMIALVKGTPKLVSLKQIIQEFFNFRIDIINRQKQFELEKALSKKHLVGAAIIVLKDIDNVILMIKNSQDIKSAQINLMEKYGFDEIQSKSILEMSLQKITNLEIEKIKEEEIKLISQIQECEKIISSQSQKETILKRDLLCIKKTFQDERKTFINYKITNFNIPNEDLIEEERVLITVTVKGYIKRLRLDTYRQQNRGGKGISGMDINENDFVKHFVIASTHDYQLFFTNKGKVYQKKAYEIPVFSRQSKGIPLINLIPLEQGEFLTFIKSISDFKQTNNYLVLITKKGLIKRNNIMDYQNVRSNGKIAFNLKSNDEVITILKTTGKQDLILAASNGKAIRFNESSIKKTTRMSSGIIGMRVEPEINIIGATVISSNEEDILVLTEFGFGKKTKNSEYKKQKRGGKGTKTLKITSKNGSIAAIKSILPDTELILITDDARVLRLSYKEISTTKSKITQGNKLISIDQNSKLVNVVVVKQSEEESIIIKESFQ
ncbi:DNA gyrase subunit A [Candidatus Phytoplasma pini]|uniref:DNA topoisomerase (ATP-hydrolyzing) n=1 Tax=Candidatus Phytoplasma pini TaxID=267362 RepID=A0A559KJZ6_9MOLU|nr:DNA gyrase subunit A [Candidatus Phytoplasma pini]TVY12439.1 DNA gyrase, alpha subunit [Candidatus Phytoplasma pini]